MRTSDGCQGHRWTSFRNIIPDIHLNSYEQQVPRTKFCSKLPRFALLLRPRSPWPATATRLLDLISRPPVDDKYKKLKDRLIDTFGLSKHERAFRLFHFRPLGDSKPSTLMDKMLGLLGDHPPCLLFEQFFLERLPEDIHIQLIDLKIEDHRQLAKWADTLWSS